MSVFIHKYIKNTYNRILVYNKQIGWYLRIKKTTIKSMHGEGDNNIMR